VHQQFGTTIDWWETYRNTNPNIKAIIWNEFKARFKTHYVHRGTLKLKKEFSELNQGSMTVNEDLNQFIQLSRYATDDVNTDEKKQDTFLKGLNDKIQFQLPNTDYPDFQHLINKAIIIENKLKDMEKDGKCKMGFPGQHSESNTRPHFLQPSQLSDPHSRVLHRCKSRAHSFRTSTPGFRCSVPTFRRRIPDIQYSISSSRKLV
jgi:hypothetical protein